jgi:hypothetical protein
MASKHLNSCSIKTFELIGTLILILGSCIKTIPFLDRENAQTLILNIWNQ